MKATGLAEWLATTLEDAGIDPYGKKVEFLVKLCQYDKEEGHPEVEQFLFKSGEGTLEDFSEGIEEIAERDAKGIGGQGNYLLKIDGIQKRFTFEIISDGDEEDEDEKGGGDVGNDFRDPSMRTAWAQQTTHNEVLMTNFIDLVKHVMKSNAVREHEFSETLRTMHREQIRNIQVYSSLMDQERVKNIELRRIEKQEERKDKTISMLSPMLKGAATKLLGIGSISGKDEDSPLLDQLFEMFGTITPEQMQEAMTTGVLKLEGGQRMGLHELMSTLQHLYEEREKAKEAAKAKEPIKDSSESRPSAPKDTVHEEQAGTAP